jgi:Ca-activated chloride channel homolog
MRMRGPWGMGAWAWAGLCLCACDPALAPLPVRSQTVRASAGQEPPAPSCEELARQVALLPADAAPQHAQLRAPQGALEVGLPLQSASYESFVVGTVAETIITQRYFNPLPEAIEAVYVFPLPHDGAVDEYTIRVQGRTLRGEMQRRDEARELYEQAKSAGHSAGLLEQRRPNLFAQRVANIPPGETIEVELRVVQPLAREHGRYRLVLPTMVGPRYTPGDAGDVRLAAAGQRCANVSIAVAIENGDAVTGLESRHHDIEQLHLDGVVQVELTAGAAVADRDFELSWSSAGERARASVMVQPADDGGYFMLTLEPPQALPAAQALPRELVFVVDTSGSMLGEPLAAAKDAMRKVLQQLAPDDAFQIIEFSQTASSLAPGFLRNTPLDVQRGLELVEEMQAEGGTDMLAGVRAAFALRREPGRIRLVLFLTDGFIGNESEVLAAVRAGIGDARLFALGVGKAVNRHLLSGLARLGRGDVSYLSPRERSDAVVDRFFERIDRPALTEIAIDWGGLEVHDVEPQRLPDLFAGQPLVLVGRYRDTPRGELTVHGRSAVQPERVAVDFGRPSASSAALAATWARARIARIEDGALEPGDDAARLEREAAVTALALEHRVMTEYTSFVAVDHARKARPTVRTVQAPVQLPGLSGLGLLLGASAGTGVGASGFGAIATIGRGTIGTIRHGAGGEWSGSGLSGSGYGRGGGGRVSYEASGESPTVRVHAPDPERARFQDTARRIVRRHEPELRRCVEQHAAATGTRLVVRFVVTLVGRVEQVRVVQADRRLAALQRCVVEAVEHWGFHSPSAPSKVVLRIAFERMPLPRLTTNARFPR